MPDASVDELRERMLPFYRTWLAVRDLEVVTIAAINGPAIGAGLALALACDLRYAAEDAKLAVPFTALGMHPGMATTWLLPEVAGLAVAREMLLTGRVVTGAEAVRLGLVNARSAARGARRGPPVAADGRRGGAVATRLTKMALVSGGHASFEAALQWEALAQPVTLATAGPARRAGRPARAPPAAVHRPLKRSSGHHEAPGVPARRSPSPCERPVGQVPGASSGQR